MHWLVVILTILGYGLMAVFSWYHSFKFKLVAYYLFSFSMTLNLVAIAVLFLGAKEQANIQQIDFFAVFFALITLSTGLFWWAVEWLRTVSFTVLQFLIVVFTMILVIVEHEVREITGSVYASDLRELMAMIFLLILFGRILLEDALFLLREKGFRITFEVMFSSKSYLSLAIYLLFLIFGYPFWRLVSHSGSANLDLFTPWVLFLSYWLIPVAPIIFFMTKNPMSLLDPDLVTDIFISSESGKFRFALAKSSLTPDQLQNNLLTAIGIAIQELYEGKYYALVTPRIYLVVLFYEDIFITIATNHKLRNPWNFIRAIKVSESRFGKKRRGYEEASFKWNPELILEFLEVLFPIIVLGRYHPMDIEKEE